MRFDKKKRQKGIENREFPFSEFDPNAISLLNVICTKTGAKVVVSSTWRHGRTVEQLQDLLNHVGFSGKVIDKTPDLCRQTKNGLWMNTIRGNEIEEWLKDKECVFVILDDDNDMLDSQRPNFVRTSWMKGLTVELAAQAIEILQK